MLYKCGFCIVKNIFGGQEMGRATDLNGLFKQAIAIRNVLAMAGLDVDIFKTREILAQVFGVKKLGLSRCQL